MEGVNYMNVLKKIDTKQWLKLTSLVIVLFCSGVCLAMQSETEAADDAVLDVAGIMKDLSIKPNYTINAISITEGIKDYPHPRQLTNFIPFDGDFTIIFAVGFTADKLEITLTDEEALGDRLAAVALAFYSNFVSPFWGSVYSNASSGKSFTISIPVFQPGVVVWLFSGYQRPSLGENPYKYEIGLSFPQ
jgi:hypothetical protein